MASTIFNLGAVKLLKKVLRFQDSDIQIITGNAADPTVTAVDAVSGSIYIQAGTSNLYIKQDSGLTTNFALTSTSATLTNYILSSQKGAANGVATLDAGGKIPSAQLPSTIMDYRGNYNASTNTPTLADGTGLAGDVYRVNVAGTQNLGSGSQVFAVGDWVVYNGTIWEKSINSNAVMTVNGFTGVVVLSTTDIAEGSNLYYTAARFNSAFASKSTSDLVEGTNLYFTNARAQSAVSSVGYLKADGSVLLTGNLNANNHRISNASAPVGDQDLANKIYVDDKFDSSPWKSTVVASSHPGTGNQIIAVDPANSIFFTDAMIDGVTLAFGDRVLIKNQTNPAENGIYTFLDSSSSYVRASDMNSWAEVYGSVVSVINGSLSGGTKWINTNTSTGTLNTTAITFSAFGASSGTVTSVSSANTDISVATGTTTPVLTLNSGVTANKIVKLNASAQLPALDASLLISLNASNISSGTLSATALPAFSGDVTTSAGSAVTTIANSAVTNVKVAAGIDAVKIANGSVSNAQFQFVSGVTSSIQTQLDNKEPLHNTSLVQAVNSALTATATNEVVTGLSFPFASFNGCSIDYRIAKGTLVRTGKMILATDGTNVAFNDMFVETIDSTIVFDAVVNGANINIRQSNTESGTITLTYQQNKFAV